MTALAAVVDHYLPEVTLDKSKQASDWSEVLSDEQLFYALEDSAVLIKLSRAITERLEAVGMADIVDLETRVFPAQVDMELNGFPASRKVAEEMATKYLAESEVALEHLEELTPQETNPNTGAVWNWNRAEDIRDVLRLLGAGKTLDSKNYPATEKTGEPSTSRDALTTIKRPSAAKEWVEAYLKYLELHKRSRDFAGKYAGLIRDGVIRGHFATVSTGRYRCEKPNLQQVPKRGKLQSTEDMRIRKVFRAHEGEKFVIADFAQVELLIAATVAERESGMYPHMLEVFRAGKVDIHTETAASLTDKAPEEVTKDERSLAKAVNFGLIYGARAETLMEYARNNYGVDITLEEANRYRTAFFERYPELAAWHRQVERRCGQGIGYSTTPLGRRRKLPVWEKSGDVADTTAKNSPIQGAGGDAIKLAMASIFEDRYDCPGNPRLRCTVHDEVVLSVGTAHAEAAKEWVEEHMAAAVREALADPESPVVVDVEVKDSWA